MWTNVKIDMWKESVAPQKWDLHCVYLAIDGAKLLL